MLFYIQDMLRRLQHYIYYIWDGWLDMTHEMYIRCIFKNTANRFAYFYTVVWDIVQMWQVPVRF